MPNQPMRLTEDIMSAIVQNDEQQRARIAELEAEIERLRAENQRASDLGLQMSLRISDLSREIDRLRIERHASPLCGGSGDIGQGGCTCDY